MAKNKRGKPIRKEEGWRGTCPRCKRTGVKLLWTDSNSNKICKACSKH